MIKSHLKSLLTSFTSRCFGYQTPCIFVLSTGRVGTDTLTRILSTAHGIVARHEPNPTMLSETRQAYQDFPLAEKAREDILNQFSRGRALTLANCFFSRRIYAETSNRLTYLAPVLADTFPKSKFIHLYRHPAEVVRSAMRRRYYTDAGWDPYRITPREDDVFFKFWDNWDAFSKCCWYWQAVNRFALDFLKRIPPNRSFSMESGSLFQGSSVMIRQLFDWLPAPSPSTEAVRTVLATAHNHQVGGKFPIFQDWTNDQVTSLKEITGPIAQPLGFEDF